MVCAENFFLGGGFSKKKLKILRFLNRSINLIFQALRKLFYGPYFVKLRRGVTKLGGAMIYDIIEKT